MKIEEARLLIKQELPSERYHHTLRVAEAAVKLATLHNVNRKHAELAAVFHDVAKYRPYDELKHYIQRSSLPCDLLHYHHELWHGPVGSIIVKETYGITNEDIQHAIRYHTTGREGMSQLELIICVADYIEPGRKIPGVDDVRHQATRNLVEAAWMVISRTIKHLIRKRVTIYPDTFFAYNDLTRQLEQSNNE